MKRILLIYLLCIAAIAAFADEITFQCKAPSRVVQGQQFRLEYVVTGTDKGDVTLPEFKGCSELFRGSSRGTNVSIINGNVSRTITNSITVTLRAEEEGTHNIEPAVLTVDGKTFKTKPLTLTDGVMNYALMATEDVAVFVDKIALGGVDTARTDKSGVVV